MATRVVSFSELDALRQCELKRHLAYTERWRLPEKSPALAKGSAWHLVMEAHYKAIERQQNGEAWGKAPITEAIQAIEDEEIRELINWMWEGYTELYGTDRGWRILGVEMPFEDWLYNAKGNRSRFRIKGKIDVLVQDKTIGDGKGLWVIDHKSCKNLPKDREYDFDDQFGIYVRGLRRKGLDIRGVIHNACRTEKLKTREMKAEERFARHITTRTDAELRVMEVEILQTFQKAEQGIGKGVLPPRSPDPQRCGWRCSFTEPCLMSRKGRDIRELIVDLGGIVDTTRH